MTAITRFRGKQAGARRLTTDCARLLIESLSPETECFRHLLGRIDADSAGDATAGAQWMDAVRHARAAGYLGIGEAEAIFVRIATSIVTGAAPNGELTARQQALRIAQLRAFGEDSLASALVREGAALLEKRARELVEFVPHGSWRIGRSRARYDPPARPVAGPRRNHRDLDADIEAELDLIFAMDDDERTAELARWDDDEIGFNVEWWRQALDPEEPFEVNTVLGFAVAESATIPEVAGEAWFSSVQGARDTGIMDRELACALLERVARAMIGPGDSDFVLADIDEALGELEATAAAGDPAAEKKRAELRLARTTREDELVREILLARGERNMVREMDENPEAFREVLDGASGEWGVS